MRRSFAVILVAGLLCLCGTTSATVVYRVNISDGLHSVVGSITTDGNTGLLNPSDITAWSLTANAPPGMTITSLGHGASVDCPAAGCGLLASLTSLSFAGNALQAFEFSNTSIPQNHILDIQFVTAAVNASNLVATPLNFVITRPDTPYVVATAVSSVPEPATGALLIIALAGVAWRRVRRPEQAADGVRSRRKVGAASIAAEDPTMRVA